MISAHDSGRSVPRSGRERIIPILLYHAIPRDRTHAASRYAVAYERFVLHVAAISASGCTPMTVGQIAEALRGERELPQRPVGITFDDGFKDNVEAIELLGEHGMCSTLYLTTAQIGQPAMLGYPELKLLSGRSDLEIGAHTVTHPRLDECSPPRLQREVLSSKLQLEHILGRAVNTFAYPHGAYDARVRSAVVAAGFTSAAAVKNALSHAADDPWTMARWTVRRSTGPDQLARVLAGEGVPTAWCGERLRTRGYRLARRFGRTVHSATRR